MRPELDPDVGWVQRLTGRSDRSARRWVEEARRDRRLFRHLAREHAREGRSSYVEIDAPLELYSIVRATRPTNVVEVGVSSGVSSAYLLAALDRNDRGTLRSIDLPSHPRRGRRAASNSWALPPDRSSGWAVPARLRSRWDLRLGDKAHVLPRLGEELDEIGLFVYDVPHDDAAAFGEFLSIDRRMPSGSIAIADHGPGGGMCAALRRWAARSGTVPSRRSGLGLFGFAKP